MLSEELEQMEKSKRKADKDRKERRERQATYRDVYLAEIPPECVIVTVTMV